MSINCRVVEARIKIASLKVMQFGYRQPNKTFNFYFRVKRNWSIFHNLIYKWSRLDFGSLKGFYKWWIAKNVTIFQAWVNSSNIHSFIFLFHTSLKKLPKGKFWRKKNRGWLQHEFNYIFVTIANWNPRLSKVKMGSLGPKKLSSTCRVDLATICENLLYCSTTTYANICLVILLLSISQGVSVAAAAADSETELAGALFSVLANPRPATPFIIRRENH